MCSVQDVLAALDINKTGTIAVTQFLAAACDKRCSGVCSIQDKPALQQCTREGAVDIAALTALLTEVGLAVSAEAVLWMMTAAGLEVKGGQVRLEDLEVEPLAKSTLFTSESFGKTEPSCSLKVGMVILALRISTAALGGSPQGRDICVQMVLVQLVFSA